MNKSIIVIILLILSLNTFAKTIKSVELVPLTKTSLLTSNDFSSAEVLGQNKNTLLNFQLKVDAATKLAQYSHANIGRPLPLLIDGKIVASPVIKAKIEGDQFQVGPLDTQLANEIASFINAQNN